MSDYSKLLGSRWASLQDSILNATGAISQNRSISGILRALENQALAADSLQRTVEQARLAYGSLADFNERHRSAFDLVQRASGGADLNRVSAYGGLVHRAMLSLENPHAPRNLMPDLSRIAHLSGILSAASQLHLESIFPPSDLLSSQLRALRNASCGMQEATRIYGAEIALSGDKIYRSASINTTVLKISAFYGASEFLHRKNIIRDAAFDALLGQYRTRMDLPAAFWRRPEVRMEVYKDAEVDPGLVEAENDQVVDILIGGGAATPIEGRGGISALVQFGNFEMRVTSTRTRYDAFAIIDAFEVAVRRFIDKKMRAVAGREWFKRRANGNVIKRAKDRRREALRNGEQQAPLIEFTDLGDLREIIIRNDNWTDCFEETFQHCERTNVDFERMIAMRRPTAHARSIDPVRLIEIVCVARRLISAMELDRPMDAGWDMDA